MAEAEARAPVEERAPPARDPGDGDVAGTAQGTNPETAPRAGEPDPAPEAADTPGDGAASGSAQGTPAETAPRAGEPGATEETDRGAAGAGEPPADAGAHQQAASAGPGTPDEAPAEGEADPLAPAATGDSDPAPTEADNEAAAPVTRAMRVAAAGAALAEMAAAVMDEPVPPPTRADSGTAEALTLNEACVRLSVTPYVLRRLMEDYADALPAPIGEGVERRLLPGALNLLADIVAWRNAGVEPGEILRRLPSTTLAPAASADPAAVVDGGADAPLDGLVARVAELQSALQRSEDRRAEDRDRLLTALMRTTQELQNLRLEVSARTRKERRKGFWSRLFG